MIWKCQKCRVDVFIKFWKDVYIVSVRLTFPPNFLNLAILLVIPQSNFSIVWFSLQGSQVWRMSKVAQVDDGYPKPISEEFKGIPNNIEAAFTWNRNRKIYIFKGSRYWRFDYEKAKEGKRAIAKKYPQNIREWKGIPGNLETVNTWINNRTYFFASGSYHRIEDNPLKVRVF